MSETPAVREPWRMPPEEIRLVSDFRDCYDHHFAGSWTDYPVWRRYAGQSPRHRSEDHRLLQESGLVAPEGASLGLWPGRTLVVAYTRPAAHRGEGKRMGYADTLLENDVPPATWAVPWIGGDVSRGRSLRLLSVGRSHYWLSYRQRDPNEWRSNVGDVEVAWADIHLERFERTAMDAAARLQLLLREPMVAIDFADEGAGSWVAIDLNTAPGVRGSPVETALRTPAMSSRDVAEAAASRMGEILALDAAKVNG